MTSSDYYLEMLIYCALDAASQTKILIVHIHLFYNFNAKTICETERAYHKSIRGGRPFATEQVPLIKQN
jgi:hypothetical protein